MGCHEISSRVGIGSRVLGLSPLRTGSGGSVGRWKSVGTRGPGGVLESETSQALDVNVLFSRLTRNPLSEKGSQEPGDREDDHFLRLFFLPRPTGLLRDRRPSFLSSTSIDPSLHIRRTVPVLSVLYSSPIFPKIHF